MPSHEPEVTFIATITQRARGVYLASASENRDGLEEWEAFSTVAAAKRWCAKWCGVDRLCWEERRRDGHWPGWFAEHGVTEADPDA